MAVAILDVPVSAWNEVVIQATLHGLDLCPDDHRESGNTVVEITGTEEKLNLVYDRIKQRCKEQPELLAILDHKPIDQCR